MCHARCSPYSAGLAILFGSENAKSTSCLAHLSLQAVEIATCVMQVIQIAIGTETGESHRRESHDRSSVNHPAEGDLTEIVSELDRIDNDCRRDVLISISRSVRWEEGW